MVPSPALPTRDVTLEGIQADDADKLDLASLAKHPDAEPRHPEGCHWEKPTVYVHELPSLTPAGVPHQGTPPLHGGS